MVNIHWLIWLFKCLFEYRAFLDVANCAITGDLTNICSGIEDIQLIQNNYFLRDRGSSSGRIHQEYIHFPRRRVAYLCHSAHGWCILLSHATSVPSVCQTPTYVARDILDAYQFGMAAYEEIKRGRLEDERPKAQFHDKITKKRLKTFSDIRKQLIQRHSTSWQECTCQHGPGGRKPRSPDERCPFPLIRAIAVGAR